MSKQVYYIRIWDSPTRLFHWLWVTSFGLAWWSQGDDRYLDIHVFSGYLFLSLLVFRLVWGFIGSEFARFRSFAYGGQAVWTYLTTLFTPQKHPHYLGHNPLGSWAIFALFSLGLLVSFTGLLTLGGEEQQGPLAGFIGFATGWHYRHWHNWLAWMMLGLVGIHIIGVLLTHYLHREPLIKAMISGFKPTVAARTHVPAQHAVAIMLILIVGGGSLGYFHGYLTRTPDQPYLPFVGPTLPHNVTWQEECGSCHLDYHPTLLPARAWTRLLAGQATHFDEDLALEPETVEILQNFAQRWAAESHLTEPAWKISQTSSTTLTPLRITETVYWQQQHQAISSDVWQHPQVKSKIHCDACHFDAQQGTFEDAAMRLPRG